MPHKTALVFFVKTPGLSPTKTRLASEIGKDAALHAYKCCLKYIEDKALLLKSQSDLNIDVFWAIAEQEALEKSIWEKLSRIDQGAESDLGSRLHYVYQKLKKNYHSVCFMGSDSPLFPVDEVKSNIMQLANSKNSASIGPTLDGGYYFFGCNQELTKTVWTQVKYSSESTLESFKDSLPKSLKLHTMATHWDIDTKTDLDKAIKLDPQFLSHPSDTPQNKD